MLANKRENRAQKKHGNIPFIIRFGKHIMNLGDTFLYYFFRKIMEGQAVTTNPWLIMAINMTVVFVVLILLGVLMEIVHLVDQLRKKLPKLETTVCSSSSSSCCQVHPLKMRKSSSSYRRCHCGDGVLI